MANVKASKISLIDMLKFKNQVKVREKVIDSAVPRFIIFMALFLLAGAIYPLCTETMIYDFKACGGVLLIATGFRVMKLKEFPIVDMIPAMVLVIPLSHLWVTYVLPLVS